VGRIPPAVCWDYIDKISKNPTKEILVLRLGPSNNDEKDAYHAFFQYLSTRDRFGVVGNANKLVKDCYIMPLRTTSPVPAALLPLSGQGLPLTRPDLLLTIIVRTKRQRAGDHHVAAPPPLQDITPVKSVVSSARVVEPLVPSLPADLDSSPYSPPGSSPEYPLPPPSQPKDSPSFQTKTSSDGGFTEKLAKLQAEVAAKRAELKKREAVKEDQQQVPSFPTSINPLSNMPVFSTDVIQPRVMGGMGPMAHMPGNSNMGGHGTSNILVPGMNNVLGPNNIMGVGNMALMSPGRGPSVPHMLGAGNQPGKSSLSMLSDADLLAKAQSMEHRPLPPPGPGMPGNLLGQGVGNLELHREEEMVGWSRGDNGACDRGGGVVGRGGGGFRGREWDRNNEVWDDRRGFADWGENRDRERRDRDWRERRGERDRGRRDKDLGHRRDREWRDEDTRGGRRDFVRGVDRRGRERSRERDRGWRGRTSGGGWSGGRGGSSALGTEDWSDDEIRIEEGEGGMSGQSSDFHRNVAAELASFDKQFLPAGDEHR